MDLTQSIELTEEQKSAVRALLNNSEEPPPLMELVRAAFPNDHFDGRSRQGKMVSRFIAELGHTARPSNHYKPKTVELTDDHKQFIRNHGALMRPLQMARTIFNDDRLTNLSAEARAVKSYHESLDHDSFRTVTGTNNDNREENTYKPPKQDSQAISRINKYVKDGYDPKRLTGVQKHCIQSLIGYLHTYRFNHQVNTYDSNQDRDLFESSFIRYTYDKHDLTQEEVDQYIVLCTEVVISSSIQANIVTLQRLLEDQADDADGRRMSMSLVESVSGARTEYNQCVKRQQDLLKDLKVKRSDKLQQKKQETQSILDLVEAWKDEDERKRAIKFANIRKQAVKDEIENLSSMEEFKFRIFGLSREEGLNG